MEQPLFCIPIFCHVDVFLLQSGTPAIQQVWERLRRTSEHHYWETAPGDLPTLQVSEPDQPCEFLPHTFSGLDFLLSLAYTPAFSYIIGWSPQSMFCLWFFVRCTCTWCCLLASSYYSEKGAMLPHLWSGSSNVLSLLLKDHKRDYAERVASFHLKISLKYPPLALCLPQSPGTMQEALLSAESDTSLIAIISM